MTLDEAITYAEESAANPTTDPEVAGNMQQLSEWLRELRDRRKRDEIVRGPARDPTPPTPDDVLNARVRARHERERQEQFDNHVKDLVTQVCHLKPGAHRDAGPGEIFIRFRMHKPGVDVNAVAERLRSMPGVTVKRIRDGLWYAGNTYLPGIEVGFHPDAIEPVCRIVVEHQGYLHWFGGE